LYRQIIARGLHAIFRNESFVYSFIPVDETPQCRNAAIAFASTSERSSPKRKMATLFPAAAGARRFHAIAMHRHARKQPGCRLFLVDVFISLSLRSFSVISRASSLDSRSISLPHELLSYLTLADLATISLSLFFDLR
jgi:hypothetical protein